MEKITIYYFWHDYSQSEAAKYFYFFNEEDAEKSFLFLKKQKLSGCLSLQVCKLNCLLVEDEIIKYNKLCNLVDVRDCDIETSRKVIAQKEDEMRKNIASKLSNEEIKWLGREELLEFK